MGTKHILKFLLAVALLCFAACSKVDNIKVSSCEVLSIAPTSLKSMNIKIRITVDNPAAELRLSDMQAMVYQDDKFIGRLEVDPVAISGHTEDSYDVQGHISLDGGVPVLQILAMARDFSPEQYKADISARVRLMPCFSKRVSMEKVKISDFIKK